MKTDLTSGNVTLSIFIDDQLNPIFYAYDFVTFVSPLADTGPAQESTGKNAKNSSAIYIGIAVPIIVVVIVALIVIFILVRRRGQQKAKEQKNDENQQVSMTTYVSLATG